jgi:hypothetical protein
MHVPDVLLMSGPDRRFGREKGYANGEDASEVGDPEIKSVVIRIISDEKYSQNAQGTHQVVPHTGIVVATYRSREIVTGEEDHVAGWKHEWQ